MRKLNLVIKGVNRTLSIPFESLELLDKYTECFNDPRELFHSVNNSLDFGFKSIEPVEMYIAYYYKPLNSKYDSDEVMQKLPIMYSGDIFDVDHLMTVLKKYYKDNHARIIAYKDGIINVKHDAIKNYRVREDNITDRDIDLAVDSFFRHGSYKKFRDSYFHLMDCGYAVKTVRKVPQTMINVQKTNLSTYKTDDDYIASLQRYAALGPEEQDEAIEELSSQYSLEDLSIAMQNAHYGIFDGVDVHDNNYEDDRYLLEDATNMSLKEIMDIVKGNKGRKR